jgi:hypothetical protein
MLIASMRSPELESGAATFLLFEVAQKGLCIISGKKTK